MKINFFEPFKPESDKLLVDRYHLVKRIAINGIRKDFLVKDLHAPGHPQRVVQQFNFDKVALAGKSTQAQAVRETFQAEAKTLSLLSLHDRIPTLIDHFETAGKFYFVYEQVQGHSLQEEFTIPTPWSDQQVIELLNSLLDTLDFIQHQRVVHTDLQPENIIRRSGDNQFIIANFGGFQQRSAQIIAPIHSISAPPIYDLTSYMSDEQIAGHPQFSSDIYAVGTIAIQALTGHHPRTILTTHQTEEIFWPSFASLRHPALLGLLERMVAADAKERYPTASTVLTAIQELPKALVKSQDSSIAMSEQPDNLLFFPTTETEQDDAENRATDESEIETAEEAVATDAAHTTEAYEDETSRSEKLGLAAAAGFLAIAGAGALTWRTISPTNPARQTDRQPATVSKAPDDARQSTVDPLIEQSSEAKLKETGEQTTVSDQTTEQTTEQTNKQATEQPVEQQTSVQAPQQTALENNNSAGSYFEPSSRSNAQTPSTQAATPTPAVSAEGSVSSDSTRPLTPEAAKSTVYGFYEYVTRRAWDTVRSFLNDDLARSLEPNFFYQFKKVSVENLRVVSQTPESIDLIVQNTYVYPDGSSQQEERSYTVALVDDQPTIVDTDFVEVTKDRSY